MLKVSATKLRAHLFDYLEKAAAGEIIIIQRNNQEIARLMPLQQANWRKHMTYIPQLLVTPEELCQPLDDLWEAYV
ncbi:MAG: type II toxin-antitoxin system prevent-host-death family antitoxin [Chloroflexi bacterium]|nr:type II toxin-antitoxin system prevent-host-death family antitoxin [Chloroflexota bacterium]